MDLVFHRYANPFMLLNNMIQAGTLSGFIDMFMKQQTEEQEWEYYLHKVFDKSFNEFKNNVDTEAKNSLALKNFNVETTIQDSIEIANMDFEIIPEN
jgi:uncharacterized protein (UPF0332 family)